MNWMRLREIKDAVVCSLGRVILLPFALGSMGVVPRRSTRIPEPQPAEERKPESETAADGPTRLAMAYDSRLLRNTGGGTDR